MALLGFVVVVSIVGLCVLEAARAQLVAQANASQQPVYTPAPHPTPTVFSTTCSSGCLSPASASQLILDASLQRSLDIDSDRVVPAPPPTTAALEHQHDVTSWNRSASAAPDCFFLDSRSPVGLKPNADDAQNLDAVAILLTQQIMGGNTTMTETARFFTDPLAAADYERQLQLQRDACHVTNAPVGPMSGFDLPPSVTAIAIADPEDHTTTYLYDFQRANVVVRFRVETSDGVNENAVRSVLTSCATTGLAAILIE